jgi:arabinogalactan endo-1,4-beta-galactosidase
MFPTKPRLWIIFCVILVIVSLSVSCTPETEPQATETPPGSNQTDPTKEPTSMETSPEIESTQSETPTSEPPTPTPGPANVINPSFEDGETDGLPNGWNTTGSEGAVILDDRGHTGDFRLTHQSEEAYQVETAQTVSGLANDWYTLRIWIRSSGEQEAAYAGLECGGEERRVHVPSTSPGYRWLQLVVSNQVVDGECTISLQSEGSPDTWASFDDVELIPGRAVLTHLGADISSLKKSEDMGGVYRYADGTQADALEILKDYGMNYARFRIWVDPADGYHDKAEILEMVKRVHSQDMKLLVNFHYSDHWADPGKQIKPAAWEDLDFEGLKQAVYDHTFDVCNSLVEQGTPPDMVQVGNEINAGMLWPDADYNNMDNLADLLKEGYRAVKDCSPSTPVMLHIAEGGDNDMAQWWFGHITRRDVPFDLIGISYYPFWQGTLAELQYNLNDISARYDKDVIVVETAYAFTDQEDDDHENILNRSMVIPGYPYTPEGQRAMLRDIMGVVRAVPNGRGLGVFWWDATWTAVPGNGWDATDPNSGNAWENQALFDFDDRALPALEEFLDP